MKEAEIRDRLASDISILGEGLTLLDKEKYIPGTVTRTRSFIDLYAKDADNHHVLIELKRTDAAARQAVHEVLKYVDAVKEYLGARDDEIRVIIASTEWDELRVPFSLFVAEAAICAVGMLLHLDPTTSSLSAVQVHPLKLTSGRYLAPWHELNYYVDEGSLAQGIAEYDNACRSKGIEDYVMVVLQAPANLERNERQIKQATIFSQLSGEEPEALLARMPRYPYILYFAMQQLSRDECLKAISTNPAQYAESSVVLPSYDEDGEDAALCYLHETLGAMNPRPHYDSFEIGYPAKFMSRLLDVEGWKIESILRRGAFSRNKLLSDAAIIEEISGAGGATCQRFKRTFSVSNKAHLASAKLGLQRSLEFNLVWCAHILKHMAEIEKDFPDAEVEAMVFNPSAGIMTLYLSVTQENGPLFVPSYHLIVKVNDQPKTMFYGSMMAEGVPRSFRNVLDEFYGGDIWHLLCTLSWGGYEQRDAEILEELGLVYRSFRVNIDGPNREFFMLRDERWRPVDPSNPLDNYYEYIERNENLIKSIVSKVGRRWDGRVSDGSHTESYWEAQADLEEAHRRGVFFYPPPDSCDLCGTLFSEEKFMIDGGLKGYSGAACMCQECFNEIGIGIGWGKGQLYMKHPEGWLLVAGFSPYEAE